MLPSGILKAGGGIAIYTKRNIDLLKTRCTKTKSLVRFVNSLSLNSLIAAPTRITNSSSTAIDHIYSNINYLGVSGTINVNIADHLPVFLVKKKGRVHNDFMEIQCRSFPDEEKEAFTADLLLQVETISFDSNDPNVVWQRFYQIVTTLLDRYCPVRTVRIKGKTQSYIDSDLALLMKRRDLAFRKPVSITIPKTGQLHEICARRFRPPYVELKESLY